MKPEKICQIDNDRYVYARCRCPLDLSYAIKIKRVPGIIRYPFKCDVCGTSGEIHTSGK